MRYKLLFLLFIAGFLAGLRHPIPEPNYEIIPTSIPIPSPMPEVRIRLSRISAYNALASQTDDSPEISSCGRNISNQIALSQDLFFSGGKKHLCGRSVRLYTDRGEVFDLIVNDTMNPRYTKTADILLPELSDAISFGVTTGYLVFMD